MLQKARKILLIIAGVCVCAFLYYWAGVSSSGTETIRYIEPEENYNSFTDILNHPALKGKVVYVDFWHTGCGPCFQEFQYMPKVKEKLKDFTEVTFLYLGKDRTVPGEKFRWKKKIEQLNLEGYHYFMSNEKFDAFWEETVQDSTKMKAFPHYLIVGANGRIADNDAPRPSSDSIVSLLKSKLTTSDL
jgi:thiol-disulfide isomerase/thioredoxin